MKLLGGEPEVAWTKDQMEISPNVQPKTIDLNIGLGNEWNCVLQGDEKENGHEVPMSETRDTIAR